MFGRSASVFNLISFWSIRTFRTTYQQKAVGVNTGLISALQSFKMDSKQSDLAEKDAANVRQETAMVAEPNQVLKETERICEKDSTKTKIKEELETLGCCPLCVERYLGTSYPDTYRLVAKDQRRAYSQQKKMNSDNEMVEDGQKPPKLHKKDTCIVCLGMLQEGILEDWFSKISAEVNQKNLEPTSVCLNVSLPISSQLRAYSLWHHLKKKFPDFYTLMGDLKPEGIGLKAVWKWVCSSPLQERVKAMAEWSVDGFLNIQLNTAYDDDEAECSLLFNDMLKKTRRHQRKKREILTRNSLESVCNKMSYEDFNQISPCPPLTPKRSLQVQSIHCQHVPVFLAGRYCKYSRTLSQTPWILDDGSRKTDTSVEELISAPIAAYFKTDDTCFSSSGREDVDVRCLGNGRPFVVELINPKAVKFASNRLGEVQENINFATLDVYVRDLQVVSKKDVSKLKDAEEFKTKQYTALCCLSGSTPVTQEMLDKLNSCLLPIELKQKTPIRVMHRRANCCRKRSIFEMKAEAVTYDKDISFSQSFFKVHVKTQAGTYVKEFVHGDLGRTVPSIAEILGTDVDIKLLDVVSVDVDWPNTVDHTNGNT